MNKYFLTFLLAVTGSFSAFAVDCNRDCSADNSCSSDYCQNNCPDNCPSIPVGLTEEDAQITPPIPAPTPTPAPQPPPCPCRGNTPDVKTTPTN